MNFNTIKNIVFDLGNVIINIDFDLTYKAFSELSDKSLGEVYQIFEKLDLWDKYEKGLLSNSEFIFTIKNALEIKKSDDLIIEAWNALLLDIPKRRIDKMKELANRYRLFILSNTSYIHIIEVNKILNKSRGIDDLKNLVEKVYYSYEIGMRKPNSDIYDYVLGDANLKAEETLFLDDNLDNIIGAKNIGIHTIHVYDKDLCEYLKDA